MRRRKNKNADENVTSLLSAMDRQAVAPDREFLKQLREHSAREFTAGAPNVSANTPKSIPIATLGRIIMKSPITKLAAAAVVVIACLIGLSLWKTTGSGIALADVLARVEQVKAVRYTWTYRFSGYKDPNKPYNCDLRSTVLMSQEYGWKANQEELDPNSGQSTSLETYFLLPQKNMSIRIIPKEKKYRLTELDDIYVKRQQQLDRELQNDPLSYLRKMLEAQYESLGRSTVDGIAVAGFRTTNKDPNSLTEEEEKLWVDVKTLLPVRYEEHLTGDDKKWHAREVEDNFQWDVPVDASEIEPPPIPDGYTSLVVKLPPNNEETATQGLKQCVEFFGRYPQRIIDVYQRVELLLALLSGVRVWDEPRLPAERLKEEIKGLTEDQIQNKLLMPLRGLERFGRRLEWEGKEPTYYGRTVTAKDTDKILLRWKVSGHEYRVIFGDLHAETVTPEKLAELEKLNSQSPLLEAARFGDVEQVKLLLSKGADVNAKDRRGLTPLHLACFSHRGRAVAELLIAQGANINAKPDGRTPLHVAAWSGNVPVAELLIAKGADIDAKANNGWTPLHGACFRGRKVVVELLIAKGTDLNVKDNRGQTGLSLAKQQGHEEIVELLRNHGAKE
jgi:hypothetical protein